MPCCACPDPYPHVKYQSSLLNSGQERAQRNVLPAPTIARFIAAPCVKVMDALALSHAASLFGYHAPSVTLSASYAYLACRYTDHCSKTPFIGDKASKAEQCIKCVSKYSSSTGKDTASKGKKTTKVAAPAYLFHTYIFQFQTCSQQILSLPRRCGHMLVPRNPQGDVACLPAHNLYILDSAFPCQV